jgi:flagellar assembly protein FliH
MLSERSGNGSNGKTEAFLYVAINEPNADFAGSPVAWKLSGGAANGNNHERLEKEAFERGVKEGETRAHSECEKQIAAAKALVADAIEKFKRERENYFSRVEPEVVQLALAIARKILHREAQMDPLLLAGMVHVALSKLDSGTRVRLWAHPLDVHFWNEYFAQPDSFQPAPELVGDPALRRGECTLETEVGSTQISLDTQLKEIEQGFFDLLEQRPKTH